ncbi:MAG TPA: nitrous oxide reductase accessory protein NosL [Thermomicrobiales bacterium]|nr:nitrous oxide reductase accessory protein NosL [Thermomicrobiales bacterium]
MNRRVLLMGAAVLTLSACGDSASADEPPKIGYGKDACDRCGMIISDERYAAAIVPEKGDTLLFDDSGEMIATAQETGLESRRAWVHDMHSKRWIDATRASFVVSETATTPMGTGVVAFQDAGDADTFAGEHDGSVLTWDQILRTWKIDPRMS